ncbi:MAG: ABC transporter substrate-binding protein [Candidatus Korarchaeota archaeon]|nr:ABC transporter substrate-binding protein [Candidatus Korarchaeota archaeon]
MDWKPLVAVVAILVILGGIYYIYSGREKGPESVRIGIVLPLSTASFASAGQECYRGMQMAVEEINSNGGVLGKPIELVVKDDKGDPNTAITVATDLITNEQVPIIVGFYSSTVTYATMNAIKQYQPIVFVMGASSVKVESLVGKERWFFHMHPWDYHRQGTVIDYFLHYIEPTPQKIFVAYEDGVYGSTSYSYFVNMSREVGAPWDIKGEPFKSGSSDFSAIILKAKDYDPDVFYIVGYPADYPVFFRNAKENDFNPKLIFIVAPEFPEYPKDIGDYVAGVDVWSPYLDIPQAKDFVAKFQSQYGRLPEYWAPFCYTAIKMVAQGIEKAGSLDREALISGLESVQMDSPLGPVSFKQTGNTLHQVVDKLYVVQWQGGTVVILYPDEFKTGELIYPVPTWAERGG